LIIGKKLDLPYEVLHAPKVANILGLVAQFQPDVIVTSEFQPGALSLGSFQIRKKWIHVPADAPVDAIINAVEGCYAFNCYHEHPNEKANPLISVYTGTYNTGDYLRECYESIRTQTYPNWEWVVVDDMSRIRPGTTRRFAQEDIRVRPFRSGKRIMKVGAVRPGNASVPQGIPRGTRPRRHAGRHLPRRGQEGVR
jgi:hypothetical protein